MLTNPQNPPIVMEVLLLQAEEIFQYSLEGVVKLQNYEKKTHISHLFRKRTKRDRKLQLWKPAMNVTSCTWTECAGVADRTCRTTHKTCLPRMACTWDACKERLWRHEKQKVETGAQRLFHLNNHSQSCVGIMEVRSLNIKILPMIFR